MRERIYSYVCCPYCAFTANLDRFMYAEFNISPLEFHILTQREQKSGLGESKPGFYTIPGSQKSILDLVNGSPQEKEVAQKILERLKIIYDAYHGAGLL